MQTPLISDIVPATEEESKLINDKIVSFNRSQVPFTQEQTPILKNYVIKDKGIVIAGVNAFIYHWCILHVNVLFVDEKYRHKNLGSALLQKVESDVKAMGGKLVHLDTLDFQAKDFYLKQGYEVFGVLEGCPEGHKRYYLKKAI